MRNKNTVYNYLFLGSWLNSSNEETYNGSTDDRRIEYRPIRVRGKGKEREGCCAICGMWFKLKNSSYWYHMNYKHGISSNGVKFPEPRLRDINAQVEGYCIQCKEWIPLGLNRNRVNFGWFKHWQKTHCKSKSI